MITEKTTQQHAERSNIQPIQNIINNEVDINHQNQKIVLNQKNIIQKQINQNNRPHPSENINSSKPISNTQTKAIPKQNTIIELTKKPIQTQIQTQAQKPPNIISLPIHKKPVPQQIQKKPLRAPSNTNLNTNVKNNTNEILSNILKPNLLSNILLKPAETNNNLIINNPEDDTQKANIKPPQERVIKEKPNNLNTKGIIINEVLNRLPKTNKMTQPN